VYVFLSFFSIFLCSISFLIYDVKPTNSYSSEAGSKNCTDCNSNETSAPGSTKCSQKGPCRVEDYSYNLTDCEVDNTTFRKKVCGG
jgi:hypothetical protein